MVILDRLSCWQVFILIELHIYFLVLQIFRYTAANFLILFLKFSWWIKLIYLFLQTFLNKEKAKKSSF